MVDKLLAGFSIALLTSFLLIIAVRINILDLWLVIVLVLAMGVFDFFWELRGTKG